MHICNPILPGFHPDPCICRVESDYFLATSTFVWFPGVQLYHSRDLVHWQEIPCPLRRTSQLDLRGCPNSGGIWAPCLTYCNGTYYLIYTVVRNYHGIFKDTPNYMVTTTDIFSGEWSEPIYLNSSGFDPSLFHAPDGKKYLVNMLWDHRLENHPFGGILLQEYSESEKRLVGEVKNIYSGTEIGCTEAPHLFYKDGWYYLLVAEGGTLYNHGVRLARSRSIDGPYETDPLPILTTRHVPHAPLQRAGHGSLTEAPDGTPYMVYLCGRPIGEKKCCILGRETALAKLYWDQNGWLRLENGGIIPDRELDVDLPCAQIEPLPLTDTFDCKELPERYKTLRVPLDAIGSLTARPGCLRLYGCQSITSQDQQAMVARRITSHACEITVKMEFKPTTFQQMAGLTVFYDTFNFFYLYLSAENDGSRALRICARNNLQFFDPLDGCYPIGHNKAIWLRVRITGCQLQFFCSFDGEHYVAVGNKMDCSNLADEGYSEIGHEGHTGTLVGMACQDLTGHGNHADFFSFTYQDINNHE
ncbi:MAG: glycoside hydrolase family 43 protein [Clostridia bacterium]|nr:glycoside hydrolase family 43 protein [Clostridia bacterium]